ncbi:hypothetical protein HDU96_009778 [Phlyctochytrium bullatum]|nr:hypothetical protein HDU96_009778 [Phlyctochytrium bullatum]
MSNVSPTPDHAPRSVIKDLANFFAFQSRLLVVAVLFSLAPLVVVAAVSQIISAVQGAGTRPDSAIVFAIVALVPTEISLTTNLIMLLPHAEKALVLRELPSSLLSYTANTAWAFLVYSVAGVFLWRLLEPFAPVLPEQPPANERKKSRLAIWGQHIISSLLMVFIMFTLSYGVSISVQVARIYGKNVVVLTVLYVVFTFLQLAVIAARAKVTNMEAERLLDNTAKGSTIPDLIAFNLPQKLFRLIQVLESRSPMPRYFALWNHRKQQAALAKVAPEDGEQTAIDDPENLDITTEGYEETPPKDLGGSATVFANEPVRRTSAQNQTTKEANIAPVDQVSSSESADEVGSIKAAGAGIESGGVPKRQITLTVPNPQSFPRKVTLSGASASSAQFGTTQSSLNSANPATSIRSPPNLRTSSIAPPPSRALTTASAFRHVSRHLTRIKTLIVPVTPYDYLRRDLCFADYTSVVFSLFIVLVFPKDFLAHPDPAVAAAQLGTRVFENVAPSLDGNTHDVQGSMLRTFGYYPWRVVVFTSSVGLVWLLILEWLMQKFEARAGFVPYSERVKIRADRVVVVYILSCFTATLLFILAGARGLFAYGPLDVGYPTI